MLNHGHAQPFLTRFTRSSPYIDINGNENNLLTHVKGVQTGD